MFSFAAVLSEAAGEGEVVLRRSFSRFGASPRVISLGQGRLTLGVAGHGVGEASRCMADTERAILLDAHTPLSTDASSFMSDLVHVSPEELPQFLAGMDGFYVGLMAGDEEIVCFRDHIGSKPLFHGEGRGLTVVTNIPGTLDELGCERKPVPPASVARLRDGWSFTRYWEPAPVDSCDADTFLRLLSGSIRRLVPPRPALFFSGGLDSSVLAKLVVEAGLSPVLVSSGLPGAKDWKNVEATSRLIGVEVERLHITEADIRRTIPRLEAMLGRLSPMHASIACVFHLQALRAAELGLRFAVAGQGADESLGGYRKYVTLAQRHGPTALQSALWEDVLSLHAFSLPRDTIACGMAGVELVLPFLDRRVLSFVLHAPPSLKVAMIGDRPVRKFLLRCVAARLGPGGVSDVEKTALQYGTGVEKVVKRMVERRSG